MLDLNLANFNISLFSYNNKEKENKSKSRHALDGVNCKKRKIKFKPVNLIRNEYAAKNLKSYDQKFVHDVSMNAEYAYQIHKGNLKKESERFNIAFKPVQTSSKQNEGYKDLSSKISLNREV